jgi:transposase
MPSRLWTFTLPGFKIDEIRETQGAIQVKAQSMTTRARCPSCHRVSDRVHSYYRRSLKDLPIVDFSVQLHLTVPRFRCLNTKCQRATFAESLERLARKHAQRSQRFLCSCLTLGLALGGEAGQRAAHKLHLPVSADTLLRILRRTPLETRASTFHVIGIDDWAFKRRESYGTLIVDLEKHQPIELLADRTAETVAAWLKRHPEIRIITRDRSTEFVRGINLGAPQAKQVADRWHLLKNLTEVLERILARVRAELSKLPILHGNTDESVIRRPENRSKKEQIVRAARRQNRLTRYEQVRTLHLEGISINQIAERLKISRTTVRKFVNTETFPEMAPRGRTGALTPFEPYLLKRWKEGCRNALQLWREGCAKGYRGTTRQVSKWVRLRREEPKRYSPMSKRRPTETTNSPTQPTGTSSLTFPSAKRLAWLLVKEQDPSDQKEYSLLKRLLQHSVVAKCHELAQQFTSMVRERQPKKLPAWLKRCHASEISEFGTFADGLANDIAAVRAALDLDWSNGQLEGQVNRLKLIKRQMYGRANFDLLRIRVLSKS